MWECEKCSKNNEDTYNICQYCSERGLLNLEKKENQIKKAEDTGILGLGKSPLEIISSVVGIIGGWFIVYYFGIITLLMFGLFLLGGWYISKLFHDIQDSALFKSIFVLQTGIFFSFLFALLIIFFNGNATIPFVLDTTGMLFDVILIFILTIWFGLLPGKLPLVLIGIYHLFSLGSTVYFHLVYEMVFSSNIYLIIIWRVLLIILISIGVLRPFKTGALGNSPKIRRSASNNE